MDRTADLARNSTFYEYHATGAGAGRLKKVTHQDGAFTSYGSDLHGRVTEQTGSADYPVRYTYDATNGWMTKMKTYRDTTGADALNGTAANESLTTWACDAATGLLTSETDAASVPSSTLAGILPGLFPISTRCQLYRSQEKLLGNLSAAKSAPPPGLLFLNPRKHFRS